MSRGQVFAGSSRTTRETSEADRRISAAGGKLWYEARLSGERAMSRNVLPVVDQATGRHLFDLPFCYDADTRPLAIGKDRAAVVRHQDKYYAPRDLTADERRTLIDRIHNRNVEWELTEGGGVISSASERHSRMYASCEPLSPVTQADVKIIHGHAQATIVR
jgi:hypothetical protein